MNTTRRASQVLLLCALALSLTGMHHVPISAGEPHMVAEAAPEARPAGDSGTNMGHDLLHLCLVVLSAAGGVLLLAWLLGTAGGRAAATAPAAAAATTTPAHRTRPPRPAARRPDTTIRTSPSHRA